MPQPYVFDSMEAKGVRAEIARFAGDAARWKPEGFDADANLRLAYYLDHQLPDTLAALKRRFPNTWEEMLPITLPITRHFVREQARVFLNDSQLALWDADKREDVEDDSDLGVWWAETQRESGLRLRLKGVDRYTTLFQTCFLKVARVKKRLLMFPFFPQLVDVVFDPDYPFDLDMAYGVRVEIGSEYGTAAGSGSALVDSSGEQIPAPKRWEFWCARPSEEQFRIIRSDGRREQIPGFDDGHFPYLRADGSAFVPLVMFTAHTEELGAFTLSNEGLHLFNRAANIAATDLQHIAESQGFGQLVISTQGGFEPPSKIVRGPNRALVLKEGSSAAMLSGSAAIADLASLLDTQIKRAAVLNSIPAGAVSIEARAVASGISLQIEMRPLLELRQDAIDVYDGPMRRLWDVIAGVYNATLEDGEAEVPVGVELRWHPGEVSMPVDPRAALEDALARYANDLCTKAEIIADLRRIPLDEARELAEQIAEENAADRDSAKRGVEEADAADLAGPPEEGAPEDGPPEDGGEAGTGGAATEPAASK